MTLEKSCCHIGMTKFYSKVLLQCNCQVNCEAYVAKIKEDIVKLIVLF
ncbi:hypothetical protein M6B38_156285 [Iris pallida]|uniref:Uncharacterized protein n=1 Tax=Iris pallida TaxID=29817 RepID=A0AAX6F408_IRIPA|nr:hypothetical protein M6B38_156280 [Iris pallida]KAJ6810944.1 hypothetical protein M6B38_156285 [Iris pallida]